MNLTPEQLAEENYLDLTREVEKLRLEISRIERQKAALVEKVKNLQTQAEAARRRAVGGGR